MTVYRILDTQPHSTCQQTKDNFISSDNNAISIEQRTLLSSKNRLGKTKKNHGYGGISTLDAKELEVFEQYQLIP